MQKLKLTYFGSPSFSADFLEKIILDKTLPVEIVLVVTQPDKPVGRKQIMTPSPIKIIANKYNIQCSTLNTQSIKNKLITNDQLDIEHWALNIKQIDLALVYAYGEIIPKEILSLPKYGFWNIHPSLLPLYRGASPIAYPLILGDKETGVSLMVMDEKMDKGPLLAQEKMEILPTETRTNLETKLTNSAFYIFKKQINKLSLAKNADFLPGHLCDNARATPPASLTLARDKKYAFELISQDHSQATYTFRFKKSDGFISFETLKKMLKNEKVRLKEVPVFIQNYVMKYSNDQSKNIENWKLNIEHSSKLLFNLFRGVAPWPGIWTLINLKNHEVRLKITEMKLINDKPTITKVQLEGKKEVDFALFQKAYRVF